MAAVEALAAVALQEDGNVDKRSKSLKDLVEKFLTEDEREAIVQNVREVEKTTSGEIVPMIVSCSYHYPAPQMTGTLALGLVFSIVTMQVLSIYDMWTFLAVFLGAYILSGLFIKVFYPLKRFFISSREMDEEVEEAAFTAFYKNNLNRTKDRTGVLIYISVFERKVWVLADSGINAKVDKTCWQDIVHIITDGIKANRQGEAICEAVKKCGHILEEHFPLKKNDRDELSNLIIEE